MFEKCVCVQCSRLSADECVNMFPTQWIPSWWWCGVQCWDVLSDSSTWLHLSLLPEEVQHHSLQVKSEGTDSRHHPVGVEAGISVHHAFRQIRLWRRNTKWAQILKQNNVPFGGDALEGAGRDGGQRQEKSEPSVPAVKSSDSHDVWVENGTCANVELGKSL